MNQRFDPNDSRPINPATWPSEQASQRIDPTTGAPVTDPLAADRQRDININNAAVDAPRETRSMWPLLIVLLAGVVLALLFWLPGEQASNTATPPATEQTTTTTPADTNTMAPADNNATAPATTPQATTPDTTTGTQPAPATGTDQQPATGTTPQATQPAPQN